MLEEFKQLQAENATLKAHNRQLVEALRFIKNEATSVTLCRLEAEATLQTPPAKLALAEAEVLRAAEEYFVNDPGNDFLPIFEGQLRLYNAIKAMQEAKNGSDT